MSFQFLPVTPCRLINHEVPLHLRFETGSTGKRHPWVYFAGTASYMLGIPPPSMSPRKHAARESCASAQACGACMSLNAWGQGYNSQMVENCFVFIKFGEIKEISYHLTLYMNI